MTARLSMSRPRRNTCRYCGIQTTSGENHSRELECLEALTAEVEKTRRLLADDKPRTPQECLTIDIGKGHRTAG